MKVKDDSTTEIMTDFDYVAEKATKHFREAIEAEPKSGDVWKVVNDMIDTIPKKQYIPSSVRLMTVFELLTNKSFPRRGKGKSTKSKMLDAITMAATDLKLQLQGAYDES